MGVDYRAVLVIAAAVKPQDFIETRRTEKVLCAHPEADAAGFGFCPVCGRKKSARVKVDSREYPLAHLVNVHPFDEMDAQDGEKEGWFGEWFGDYEATLGGLTIINLNDPEAEAQSDGWALGVEVLKSGSSNGGERMSSSDAAALEKALLDVRAKLAALGLGDRPVMVHCILDCSY